MNPNTCLRAVVKLLSPRWQTAPSGVSLSTAEYKLERSCGSYRRNRRGAAAVEFAIVAPVFFLLVFGMIEYGRMVMVQQVLTNASREGARRAVLDGATTAEVRDVVDNYLASASINPSAEPTTVSPNPPTDAEFGDPVTVTVSVPFNEVSWLPSPMYLGGKTLTATTVMRRESVQ
jgi:Flp pilus assembly protein TadG